METLFTGEQHGDLSELIALISLTQCFINSRAQDGCIQMNLLAVFSRILGKVTALADEDIHTGNHFLEVGVNGRIGNLGKELLEIVEQGLLLIGQNSQGGVITHGAHRVDTGEGHGEDGAHSVLVGPSEKMLHLFNGILFRGFIGYLGDLFSSYAVLINPVIPGPFAIKRLELGILLELAGFGVQKHHLVRTKLTLTNHIIGRDIQYTGF